MTATTRNQTADGHLSSCRYTTDREKENEKMGYQVQHVQLTGTAAALETANINLMAGRNTPPENIMYVHVASATMDDDELLNITGKMIGVDSAVTANVHAQLTMTGGEVIRLDLSTEAKGFWQLTFTATELDADQTIDITIITW
jgi:hypothetical protein